MAENKYIFNLIVVDDGNSKDIADQIRELTSKARRLTTIRIENNRGKGYALRAGVRQSKADFILYCDVDFPYTVESVLRICDKLVNGGSAFVIGVRDQSYYHHIPHARRLLSKTLQFLNKHVIRIPHSDTQCGLKGFHKSLGSIFLETQTNRYLIDLEFIKKVHAAQISISDQQVQLRKGIRLSPIRALNLGVELSNYLRIVFLR